MYSKSRIVKSYVITILKQCRAGLKKKNKQKTLPYHILKRFFLIVRVRCCVVYSLNRNFQLLYIVSFIYVWGKPCGFDYQYV